MPSMEMGAVEASGGAGEDGGQNAQRRRQRARREERLAVRVLQCQGRFGDCLVAASLLVAPKNGLAFHQGLWALL